ncbi:hypothetical protein ACQU0X_23905 [Pseudovibrio ascidiaceicola]|uniref:hypothetical protein n=1 Tax=Pseudovibrio ascidiaceicola TaxID=285279 RepID=UPI003D35BC26
MSYRVDVWTGETHMTHALRREFDEWEETAQFMEPLISIGMLCNVMRTDFKASPDRVVEIEKALLQQQSN